MIQPADAEQEGDHALSFHQYMIPDLPARTLMMQLILANNLNRKLELLNFMGATYGV